MKNWVTYKRNVKNALSRFLNFFSNVLLIAIGSVTLLGGISLLWRFLESIPTPQHPHRNVNLYARSIKDGDLAFNSYRYVEALELYRDAESKLDELIRFESESPSKNIRVLQRYYNSKTLLRTRVQLVLIVTDLSKINDSG